MEKETIEQLVAAQLASGMLRTVLDPKDEFDEMARTSVLLYQLVLAEVRKEGVLRKSSEPGIVTSLHKARKETE